MSIVMESNSSEDSLVGEGVKEFAEEIERLIGYSSDPQRYDDIREHFAADEDYFEEDLDYIHDALGYLEGEGRIKRDVRIFGVEEPAPAYVLDIESI